MKRIRADSAESAVQAMVDAAKARLVPPEHVKLRDGDEPFWDAVIGARARDEWTGADMAVAAQLARCQHDIEVESVLLDSEGTVTLNDRGTRVANARFSVLEQLCRREMALLRTLRMGGEASGDFRDEIAKRKVQKNAKAVREQLAEEELLAS